MKGTYAAQYVDYKFGRSSTGSEQIGVLFELLDPEVQGRRVVWYGSWTEAALPITVEGLKALGWQGKTLTTLRADLRDASRKRVNLVLDEETYKGKTRTRVQFINRQTEVRFDRELPPDEKKVFGMLIDDMLAKGHGERKESGAGGASAEPEDDIPF